MNYTHIAKKTTNVEPGLTDFLIGIKSQFSSLKKPVAPFTSPGDSQKITDTHEFTEPYGFYRAYQIKDRHEGKGDSAGTFGSKTLVNEFKVFMPGLDAEMFEFAKAIQNEEVITLHRDSDCDNEQWIQLGNDCRGARVEANYTTGTFEPTGEKGLFLTIKWTGIPYVYSGTVTIFTATS